MPLSLGTKLGPYVVDAPLGAGGMGEVYRARDTRLDRRVAIKVLPTIMAESAELHERFERVTEAPSKRRTRATLRGSGARHEQRPCDTTAGGGRVQR